MRKPFKTAVMLGAALALALAFSPGQAQAQTEPITATVTVQNALTITEVDPLDFGTVAAISDATDVAVLAIDAITAVLTPTTSGPPATFAVVDSTAASRAQITIEDGALGASLNYTINNVVNPIFGGNAFLLTGWETAYNAGAVTARTAGTPFSYVFAGPIDTLNIGAEIRTQTTVPLYADGVYAGSFDVVASY
jgi:spore coat protein U-like protein